MTCLLQVGPYRVTEQNGIGQNGTDKMVRTKWYGQNGSNCIDSNSTELNFYSVTTSHKQEISLKEAGLMKKIILSVEAGLLD